MRTLTKIVLLMPLAAWPLTGQSGTESTVAQLNKRLEQLKARQAADARRLRRLEKQLAQLMAQQGAGRQVVQDKGHARQQPLVQGGGCRSPRGQGERLVASNRSTGAPGARTGGHRIRRPE